jgi:hypothetical protein
MNILYCRPAWATPFVREIPFDWRDFEPLARSEASKFYHKQERGRFRFEDILSEAYEALATSKSVKHAIECIKGALIDFARDGDKLVKDVELSEEEWRRTRGEPARPSQGPWRVYFENGVRVMVCPIGPYRSNAQLLAGTGKPTSRHGKVPCAIGRTVYNDTWNQEFNERVSAGSSDEQSEQEAERLSKRDRVPQRGELGVGKPKPSPDYKGAGRWSKSCLNAGKVHKSGLTPDGWQDFKFVKRGGKVIGKRAGKNNGEPKFNGKPGVMDRTMDFVHGVRGEPVPDAATSVRFGLAPQNGPAGPVEARAITKVLAEIPAEDREASPEAAKLALSMETPKISLPKHWLSTTPVDMTDTPWGLPDFGVFCRGDLPYFGKKKNPWRRGKNIFASVLKFPVWADTISEGSDPKPFALKDSAVRSGSRAGRAASLLPPNVEGKRTRRAANFLPPPADGAILLPPDAQRAVAGTESAADGAAPFFNRADTGMRLAPSGPAPS